MKTKRAAGSFKNSPKAATSQVSKLGDMVFIKEDNFTRGS